MGRVTSTKVGRGTCPDCGEPVTYRLSIAKMLTHKCDCCDSSGYAQPDGEAFKKRMATIKNPIAEADAPKPATVQDTKAVPGTPAAPAPAPAPATKKQNSVFSFADLK